MALQELKILASEMARPFNDNHDKHFMDGLPEVKQCLDDYRRFSETLQAEFVRTSTGSSAILRAYHVLYVDYAHPNINWTVNDHWLERQREIIDDFKEIGHISFAHMLQIRRLLNHASLIDIEGEYILHGREQFLQEFRHILGNENLRAHIPSAFRDCPYFIPRALLNIPSIRDSIQKVGNGDCLGRSACHIIADAGYPAHWTQDHASQVDVLGRSGLYFGCRDGKLELVKNFLRLGAKLNQKTVTGSTPLHVAAIAGHLDILGWLCNQFFEELNRAGNSDGGTSLSNVLDERDCTGRSPLFWAASGGHNKIVEYLCMRMGEAKRTKDNFGSTPMSLAVRNGHFAVVKLLLNSRFAWDAPDNMGRSPFWYAVSGFHIDIMEELGKYVNVDRKDKHGRTPLAEAASRGFTRGVRYLLGCNEYDKAGIPLRLRVDPASRDNQGTTILVLAAEAGKSDCVSELFRLHPRPFSQDDIAAATEIAVNRQNDMLWAALRRPRFI
jgi:ankyrin repeat protein